MPGARAHVEIVVIEVDRAQDRGGDGQMSEKIALSTNVQDGRPCG